MAGVRETTIRLIEMAEQGILSWQAIAEMALWYMSEDDVKDMARVNDLSDGVE
jgi:hypothetical protein